MGEIWTLDINLGLIGIWMIVEGMVVSSWNAPDRLQKQLTEFRKTPVLKGVQKKGQIQRGKEWLKEKWGESRDDSVTMEVKKGEHCKKVL